MFKLWRKFLFVLNHRQFGYGQTQGVGRNRSTYEGKKEKKPLGVSIVAHRLRTWHCLLEDMSLIPGLTHWVKNPALPQAAGVGCRYGSDLARLWLWCRPAAAPLIRPPWPLARGLPYASDVAVKRRRRRKKKPLKDSCSCNYSFFSLS